MNYRKSPTYHNGRAIILRADARNLPLADASVDLVMTSPPFLNLRSYQDNGQHYEGQIGTGTQQEFLEQLWTVTAECVRVLKPTGSIFVELGDSYTSKSLNLSPHRYAIGCVDRLGLLLRAEIVWSRPNGLPESVTDRVRRSHSVWFHFVKQPRYFSAVDEIREEHAGEFLSSGVRNPRHRYPDGKMPSHSAGTLGPSSPQRKDGGTLLGAARNPLGKLPGSVWEIDEGETWVKIPTPNTANAENANKPGPQPSEHGTGQPQPGSVWTIPTQPLTVPPELGVDHFAAYPMEWPRRIIQGWTPNGICSDCGEGRRPLITRQTNAAAWTDLPLKPGDIPRLAARPRDADPLADAKSSGLSRPGWRKNPPKNEGVTGYSCGCPIPLIQVPVNEFDYERGEWGVELRPAPEWQNTAPTIPAVVLDPFGGTGTTALVAKALGRIGITIDLSADYCRLAEWRCNDPRELAAALQIEKPEPISPDQLSLFGEFA